MPCETMNIYNCDVIVAFSCQLIYFFSLKDRNADAPIFSSIIAFVLVECPIQRRRLYMCVIYSQIMFFYYILWHVIC